MEKDIARLREAESEKAREKIVQIRTGQESGKELERLKQLDKAAEERERMKAEAKRGEEELVRLRAEREEKAASASLWEATAAEEEKERLRAQFKEAQLKEEEERRKFLEKVEAKAEGREVEEKPIPPEIEVIPAPPEPPPTPPEIPVEPTEPVFVPPVPPVTSLPPEITPLPADLPAEAPTGAKAGAPPKKPFKFHLPSIKIPKFKFPSLWLPKVSPPKVSLPKFTGYFPTKPSILGKIWIRVVASFFILAILATIVTFWYWYLTVKEEPAQTPIVIPQEKQAATAPLPLIPTENVETIEITASAELPSALFQTLQKDLSENKFTRLLIKNAPENEFLGLKEFFDIFQVKTPENFYDNINNDFTLFILSTPSKNQLGFIAKTESPAVLRSILELWEQTLQEDTNNLFSLLGDGQTGQYSFQKSSYRDAVIHYLSFPGENFGICWAITDNYFIFTSSGQSIVKTIDRIKE